MDEKKTVRVRIAVAVDEHGHWNAAGWHGYVGDDALIDARDPLEDSQMYWLEVDLPVPAPVTVSAVTVTEVPSEDDADTIIIPTLG